MLFARQTEVTAIAQDRLYGVYREKKHYGLTGF
jgi:hypothetical protein